MIILSDKLIELLVCYQEIKKLAIDLVPRSKLIILPFQYDDDGKVCHALPEKT